LNGLINWEPLKRLHIKDPIVKRAFGSFVSVNTFSLTKHLFSHRDSPFPRAASREILNHLERRRVLIIKVSSKPGQANYWSGEKTLGLALVGMMPLV
jgi:hypothetical protein